MTGGDPRRKTSEAGQEIPLCAGHRHSGREGVQPDGLAPQQDETELIWGDQDNAMQLFLKDNPTI